jgi:hypothetical protein
MMKKSPRISVTIAALVGVFATSAMAATIANKHFSEAELKLMDTNKDNMVSKAEYLSYNEKAFNKMQLTNGMIMLKGNSKSNISNSSMDDESSMNNKPIGTTSENPDVNERDAVNGKSY